VDIRQKLADNSYFEIAYQNKKGRMVLKRDLLEFIFSHDLKPSSPDYKDACKAWFSTNFPKLRESQREKMLKHFVYKTKAMYEKLQSNPSGMMKQSFFSRQFTIPYEDEKITTVPLKKIPADNSKVTSTCGILYLDPSSLSAFPDTKIVSKDGFILNMNRAVLASISPLLRSIIKDIDTKEDMFVFLDINESDLKTFHQFATVGVIDSVQMNSDTKANFGTLGINLDQLTFDSIKKEESLGDDGRTLCYAKIIEVKAESELLMEGETFVRTHAIKHCILNSYNLRSEELVKLLSQHYLQFHGRQIIRDVANIKAEQTMNGSDGKILEERTNKRKQDLKPRHCVDQLEVVSETAEDICNRNSSGSKDKLVDEPLPLGENGQKLQAQLLFDSMIQSMIDKGEISDEENPKEEKRRKKKEEKESITTCIACGKLFFKYRLTEHLAAAGIYHNNKCPRCPGVEFSTWSEHQEHQTKFHNGVYFSRCKHCPEYFENPTLLRHHFIHAHKKDKAKKEQCSECGLFVSGVRQHKQIVHGKEESRPYQCEVCKKRFVYKSALNTHMKSHRKFCCTKCGKNITEAQSNVHNLLYHTPEHEKPFICSICDPVKGFIYKKFYDDHMNIHDGVKPHVCKLCPGVGYASLGNLNAHIRATHQGKKRKSKLRNNEDTEFSKAE